MALQGQHDIFQPSERCGYLRMEIRQVHLHWHSLILLTNLFSIMHSSVQTSASQCALLDSDIMKQMGPLIFISGLPSSSWATPPYRQHRAASDRLRSDVVHSLVAVCCLGFCHFPLITFQAKLIQPLMSCIYYHLSEIDEKMFQTVELMLIFNVILISYIINMY